MHTLSAFRRRLFSGDVHRDVALSGGTTAWLDAQEHYGENIGDTDTHALFIERKEGAQAPSQPNTLGPGETPNGGPFRPIGPR